MRLKKVIAWSIVVLIILFSARGLDLFQRYNCITGIFDLHFRGPVYPQCEFQGKRLDDLNLKASQNGFTVIYVDCDIFYTLGMGHYYSIMSSEFEKNIGPKWLEELYKTDYSD